jgi:heptosyltransferase-2
MGWYDDVLYYDKNVQGGMKGFLGAAGEIRRNGFDLSVLFTNSFGSALMMKLAGVRERVGYLRGGRGRLLTRGPRPVMRDGEIAPQPMVDYYGELCSFLGCGTPGRSPRLVMTEGEVEAGAEFLISRGIDPESPLLGLVPGAGYGTAKMWPPEYFARAGDALAEMLSARPVIFAEAKDAAVAGEIAGRMSHKPLDMSGEETATSGLGAMKQLMSRCSLVLTTDSGPRHVAAALGTPVVVVMGSADPVYSTTGQQHVSVQRAPVDCSPCMLRECPTDHRCMVRL